MDTRSDEETPLLQPVSRPTSFVEPLHDSPAAYRPSIRNRLRLAFTQTVSFVLSSFFLGAVVTWAILAYLPHTLWTWIAGKEKVYDWEDAKKHRDEEYSTDIRYYAQRAGFDIVDEDVTTDDGYILRMHRVVNPRRKQTEGGGYPVLLLHGLFQSSGAFITSEERSLAFWLAEHGDYQVYMGNTRGVFGTGHTSLSRGDPRFWDWTMRELALYDLPALVDYVCQVTGHPKIAFIGHSQGNALAFVSLSQGMRPDIGNKLSCFIALAPAVYAGPLTHGFPFTVLRHISWKSWRTIFGVLDFIPLMRYSYALVPARPFAAVGYIMFAYLFSWTDTNWLKRRKTKVFRFTPTPVSSASIFWWCGEGGFATRKCTMDTSTPQWFDKRFPPLSLYYGGRDFLVAAEPLLERLKNQETDVRLIRAHRMEEYEHCDFYLAADAVEGCINLLREDIEQTRTDRKPTIPTDAS